MCSSKKGIATRQLHRTFGGSLKTAWFLGHRIREAMTVLNIGDDLGPLGGANQVVEADGRGRQGSQPEELHPAESVRCCRLSSAMDGCVVSMCRT